MNKNQKRFSILTILILIAVSTTVYFGKNLEEKKIYYRAADQRITLSSSLNEISGLCMINKRRLAAVQDEKGTIYILDSKTGEIKDKMKFSNGGDYEGIAKTKDFYYIVNSKGDIFEYDIKEKDTKKYNTPFKLENDIEGVCFFEEENALLIAVKGKPNLGKKKKSYNAIYKFDLESKKLLEEPFFKIKKAEIEEKLDRKLKSGLGPSGIALYNNHFHIISSISKVLLIYDFNGVLQSCHNLNPKETVQPEGICFINDTMYISNEKNTKKPSLLIYHLNEK